MKEAWIDISGRCENSELSDLLNSESAKTEYFISGYTDKFMSGKSIDLKNIDVSKLLEIRAFSKDREFLAHRGSIGEQFEYRVAVNLSDSSEVLLQYQYIDINEIKSDKATNNVRNLITTGGGHYSLPISDDMKKIRIMSYLKYDSNGMAKICDSRIMGFVKEDE